jgi:hypothetical protein
LTLLLVLNILTGFAFVFGHVWLLIGLGIASGGMLRAAEASIDVPPKGVARPRQVSDTDRSTDGDFGRTPRLLS